MFRKIIKSSRIYHWPIIVLNASVMEYSLSQTWHLGFIIGVALCFAASYGFLVNDIKDVNTDHINGVDRLQNISKKELFFIKLFATFFFVLSLGISSIISLSAIGVVLSVLVGLSMYSFFVRKMIFANILCSLMCISPLWGIYFINPIKPDLFHAGIIFVAFILILVREIVSDTEDRKGDEADGRNSLPILVGIKNIKIIVFSLTVFGFVFLVSSLSSLFFQASSVYKVMIIGLIIGFSLLFIVPLVAIYRKDNKQTYKKFGFYTRYGMVILPLFLLASII